MKSIILAAVLWADSTGHVVTVYNTDEMAADFGRPPGVVTNLVFDEESNAALLANVKANLPNTILTNGVVVINGATQNVAAVKSGGKQFLFTVVTNRLRTNFGVTVTNAAQLRADLPSIFVRCDATNSLAAASSGASAAVKADSIYRYNSVVPILLQLQILEGQ